jgi:plasmid stabilization system protein ParE
MKRYEIRVEPEAEAEIADELRWWDLHSPARAEAIVDELEKVYRRIRRLPESGRRLLIRGKWSETLRWIFLEEVGYRLFYDVDEERRRVYVLMLWHQARRPPNVQPRAKASRKRRPME